MTVESWLEFALADARHQGLDLEPLLRSLAEATRQLRAADWNDDARGERAETGRAPDECDGGG